MAAVRIGDKPLEFAVEADSALPFELYGDEIRIKQILTNFISNAIKFTDSGRVTLRVTGTREADDMLRLSLLVADTGSGIRQEDLPKLFSSFSQVDTRKNRAKEGTGLGLAICKQLTELMGGEVSVESTYGEGSTFSAVFPQKIIDATPMGDFRQLRNGDGTDVFAAGFMAPKARVLIVDDNEVNLAVAEGLLAPYQMAVSTATSAADGLALLQKERYDIIFMDHMMPVMDGIEATQKIRQTDKDTPIIALTANAVSGVREMYLKNGFSCYLAKPIEVSELNAVLEEYLPRDLLIKTGSAVRGSQDLTDKILRTIYLEGMQKLPKLRRLYEERDIRNYTIEVHALKSVAMTAKQIELGSLAKAHEDAGKAGDWSTIAKSFERLVKLYGAWLASLAYLADAKDNASGGTTTISREEIAILFARLKEYAESYDIDSVNNVLDRLRGVSLDNDDARRLKSIEAAAELLDYDGIAKA